MIASFHHICFVAWNSKFYRTIWSCTDIQSCNCSISIGKATAYWHLQNKINKTHWHVIPEITATLTFGLNRLAFFVTTESRGSTGWPNRSSFRFTISDGWQRSTTTRSSRTARGSWRRSARRWPRSLVFSVLGFIRKLKAGLQEDILFIVRIINITIFQPHVFII